MKVKDVQILFTDEQCIIGGNSYPNIPLLLDQANQIIEVASDWLRSLAYRNRKATGSVRQYAYHLKQWWEFLAHQANPKITWDRVDDSTLITWRDTLLSDGKDEGTANSYLSTVFRMYLWAERNGYVHRLIGEPDLADGFLPPLSVEVVERNGSRRHTCPLLIKTHAKPVLPTPTNEEITRVHQALAKLYQQNPDLLVRDALILSWAELLGLRRGETLSLRVSQIPEWDEILGLEEADEKQEIQVVGKGRKTRVAWADANLLMMTRNYIEVERQAVVDRKRESYGPAYKNPNEIFLSSKTGDKLTEDAVSQKFAQAFREAGVKGSIHRVRARFLTDLVDSAVERELEKLGGIPDSTSVLLPVAQVAGHSNPETLRFYYATARKRLLRQTSADRKAAADERALSAERRADITLSRLRRVESLSELVEAVQAGKPKVVAEALRKFCDSNEITELLRRSM